MLFHDPKKLTETSELDYFDRPRRFWRRQRVVRWLALVVAVGVVACTLLPPWRFVYQAGPVSVAHTMFNQDCSHCHTGSFAPVERLLHGDAKVHSVTDQACIKCHAGPDHHAPWARSKGCADCHKEHRGRGALAQVADGHCTSCHADPKDSKPCSKLEAVTDLASHPEFALWRDKRPDPGTIEFDHAKHLGLGANMDVLRGRGMDGPLAKLKEQQCVYCHRTDPAGRYMLPIKYDHHCKECHPLQVQVFGKWQGEVINDAARRFAQLPLPHPAAGLGPVSVRAVLRERYLEFARAHPRVQAPAALARPVPGSRRGFEVSGDLLEWAGQQLNEAERLLFDGADGCRRCHSREATPTWDRPGGLPDHGKPHVPSRWFTSSKFSHDRHRMMNCLECHAGARTSNTKDSILMPRVADCRQCHQATNGARASCFECHDYHDRSAVPRQGSLTTKDCRKNWEGLWPSK